MYYILLLVLIVLMLFNASHRNEVLMKTNDITHYLLTSR
jgi:hypothetical protein